MMNKILHPTWWMAVALLSCFAFQTEQVTCELDADHSSIEYGLDKSKHYQETFWSLGKKRHKTNGGYLCFTHVEKHGEIDKHSTLTATILNWKREKVVSLQLTTHQGKNWYAINLAQGCTNLSFDTNYILELKDSDGEIHYLRFQYSTPVALEANVTAQVKFLNCDGQSGNEIDYTGAIQGGISPYQVTWKISAHQDGQQASQTKTEEIRVDGTLSISETKLTTYDQPSYYVLMKVKDACGQELDKTLHVTCTTGANGANSINVDIIDLNNQQNNGN